VDLATGRVVEYEVLARWQDDCGANHDAAQFIGAAEDTGVIGALGSQVLQSALELAAGLCRVEGSFVPRLSVNVSTFELADLAFVDRVSSMLAAASVPPCALQLEFTDTVAALQAKYVGLTISRLRATGVRVALDGFGANSANLRSLSDLDVDVVKLDPVMSFDALSGSRPMDLLRCVIELSGQLGVEVIAKGIETIEQHELLLQLGCRYGQGFLYSPPRPASELKLGYALPPAPADAVDAVDTVDATASDEFDHADACRDQVLRY
jgi:EAL domain-containing protein (putative c-di-GMP-specific phosphodiesterase class I)